MKLRANFLFLFIDFIEIDYHDEQLVVPKELAIQGASFLNDHIFALYKKGSNWTSISNLWVGKKYRGNGYAKQIMDILADKYGQVRGIIGELEDLRYDEVESFYKHIGCNISYGEFTYKKN